MASSLGPTLSVLVKVFNNRAIIGGFSLEGFLGVIAMRFMLALFYFISLEIALNILIWYQSGLTWTLQ